MKEQVTHLPDRPADVVGAPSLGLGDVAALLLGAALMAVAIFWPRRV